jgi:hypothetical protein
MENTQKPSHSTKVNVHANAFPVEVSSFWWKNKWQDCAACGGNQRLVSHSWLDYEPTASIRQNANDSTRQILQQANPETRVDGGA